MTQRTKTMAAILATVTVLVPPTAQASLFGIPGLPDIVWDPTSVAEIAKDVESVTQLIHLSQEIAAFVENPSDWRNAMGVALAAGDAAIRANAQVAVYYDPAADLSGLERWDKAVTTSQMALRQSVLLSGRLRTQDAALLAMLSLQQIDALQRRDEEARRLKRESDIAKYQADGIGELGNVSETFKGRILK